MSEDLMSRSNGDDWTWVWTTPEPTDWTDLVVEIRRGQDSDDELVASTSASFDVVSIVMGGHTDVLPDTALDATPAVLAWGLLKENTGADVFEPGVYWMKVIATSPSLGGTKTVMHRILQVEDGGSV